MFYARILTCILVSLQVHIAFADWTKALPGQWQGHKIENDFFMLHEPDKDWWIILRRTRKETGDKNITIAQRKKFFAQIETELEMKGSITVDPRSKNTFKHQFTSDGEKYFATERVLETKTHFVSVLVDTDEEQDQIILSIVPEDPFNRSREPATEAGFCPNCFSVKAEKPLTDFLKGMSDNLTQQCQAQDTKTDPRTPTAMQSAMTCVKGLGLGVLDVVRGGWGILSFLINSMVDSQYRSAVGASAGVVLWKVLRDPFKYIGLAWDTVKSALSNSIKNFRQCGSQYQVATICKFLGESLLPGGALFKTWKKISQARKTAKLEKIFQEALADSVPRSVTPIAQPGRTPLNRMVNVDGNDVSALARMNADVPGIDLQRIAREEKLLTEAVARFEKLGDPKLLAESKVRLTSTVYANIRQQISKDPSPSSMVSKIPKLRTQVVPAMQQALARKGIKTEVVEVLFDAQPWERKVAKLNQDLIQLRKKKTNILNVTMAEFELEKAQKLAKQARALQDAKVIGDIVLKVDVTSHPHLLRLNKKYELENIQFSMMQRRDGEFDPESTTIFLQGIHVFDDDLFTSQIFRHELHHQKTTIKKRRGQKGPMYASMRGFDSFGGYSDFADFDELPAWHRSLGWTEKFIKKMKGEKQPILSPLAVAERLKKLSVAANTAVKEVRSGIVDGTAVAAVRDVPTATRKTWFFEYKFLNDPNKAFTIDLALPRNARAIEVELGVEKELDRLEVLTQGYIDFAQRKIDHYSSTSTSPTKNISNEGLGKLMRDLLGKKPPAKN